MNKYIECPICGGNRSEKRTQQLDNLIEQCVLISEYVNPGGRELIFKRGGRIQLTNECNACDHLLLVDFLENAIKSESE